MPIEEPDATSTPTTVPIVKGRKGIRDNISVQSPIDLDTSRHQYETRSYQGNTSTYRTLESAFHESSDQFLKKSPRVSKQNKPSQRHAANRSGSHNTDGSDQDSEGEGWSSDGDYYEPQSVQQNEDSNESKFWRFIGFLGVLTLVLGLGALYFMDDSSSEAPPLDLHQKLISLEKEFNGQDEDFWLHIKVSIKEIPILNQPRTILFLYNNKAESTLHRILDKVSDIALCNLSQCTNNAVVIEGASLNTSEIVNDYGKIISKYRDSLEENGVMIVKNLEKVPGMSAQAFHSFCDDYNPVVKNALILFTLKVDKLPEGYPMTFVENFLLTLWSDIGKDDKFYPLFTRISGTILRVRPE